MLLHDLNFGLPPRYCARKKSSPNLIFSTYNLSKSTESQRPRMYDFPKTHKEGTSLCPILSLAGSSHHKLGKWLTGLSQPVLERFLSYCISNLFTFAKTMKNLGIDPDVFMCFFDVSSLFTNLPFDETIKICSESLYDKSDSQPVISKNAFAELIKSATSSVEFNFNSTRFQLSDGVAMESQLSPILTNIFVLYYKENSFSETRKPPICFRYVDDTFAIFDHEAEADEFLATLNCLHSSLKFTLKERENQILTVS